MIAKMEHGWLIEVAPPPEKIYPTKCPWKSPDACKTCELKKSCNQ